MTRETWVIARGILIDAGIEPAWAKVKTGEQYLVRDAEVVRLRHATLQEAARAVCRGCCEMDYNQLTQDHRQQINDHGDFVGGPCLAIGIHDLISQLGKEGEHE